MKSVPRKSEGFPGQQLVVIPADAVERGMDVPVVRDLQVTHLGRFSSLPGQFVPRLDGARQWVLVYCVSGRGRLAWDSRRWKLITGDLAILPPDETHVFEADLVTPWSVFWFRFTGKRVPSYLEAIGWSREQPVLHVPAVDTMVAAFDEVSQQLPRGFTDAESLVFSTAFRRFLGALKGHARTRDRAERETEEKLLEILQKLREAPQVRWSVPQMAQAAGLSVSHFADLFREYTGSPPLTLLIRLRLQMACEILANENLPIGATAKRVGYEDADYFSRLFRTQLGITPSRFRAEVRTDKKAKAKSKRPSMS